jgi:hypothetical protein
VKRILAAALAAFAFTACSDPADSPECKRWQSKYEQTRFLDDTYTDALGDEHQSTLGALLRAGMLENRPDGCLIP